MFNYMQPRKLLILHLQQIDREKNCRQVQFSQNRIFFFFFNISSRKSPNIEDFYQLLINIIRT